MKKRILILIIFILVCCLFVKRNQDTNKAKAVAQEQAKIERERLEKETTEAETTKNKLSANYTKADDRPDTPVVGMRESRVQETKLGRATKIEECMNFDMMDNKHRWKVYTWDLGGGKRLVAKLYYNDGYGVVHDIEKYPQDPYGKTIEKYWK
jgi:asparagine N-glycosylation enzyme membrane subunit Stt3